MTEALAEAMAAKFTTGWAVDLLDIGEGADVASGFDASSGVVNTGAGGGATTRELPELDLDSHGPVLGVFS